MLRTIFLICTVAVQGAGAQNGGIVLKKPADWTETKSRTGMQFTAVVPGSNDRVMISILAPKQVTNNFAATFGDAVRLRVRPGEKVVSSGDQMPSTFGRVHGFARGVVVEDAARRRIYRLYVGFDLKDHMEWLEGEAPNQEDWPRFAPSLSSFIDTFQFVRGKGTPQTSGKTKRP